VLTNRPRGSVALTHVYLHNKELFSGLFWIAVGFTHVDQDWSIGAYNRLSRRRGARGLSSRAWQT